MTDVVAVRAAILSHYRHHRRALPWREIRDPYATWVSEVMLQQTRVDTVVPYYLRFLDRFPTVAVLAAAPEADVLAHWSGLGYYRRARMLHAGAQQVMARHRGVVPGVWNDLRALPGVGDYTAGAIGSIAFGLRVPVVDGNVERVLSRLHGLRGDPRAPAGRKVLQSLAARYADDDHPCDVNQALMELGATVCTPASPRCSVCPVQPYCVGVATGDPERLPEKPPRARARDEQWCALVASDSASNVWLTPATAGRWQGMLLPPLIADPGRPGIRWLAAAVDARGSLRRVREAGTIVHVLTHARMTVRVCVAELTTAPPRGQMVALADLPSLAVPKITQRILAVARDLQPSSRKR